MPSKRSRNQVPHLGHSVVEPALRSAKFRLITPRTHELNVLYDWPGQILRKQGELLRLRKYGNLWIFTHKSKSTLGKHKTRIENETKVVDGRRMDMILRALGFKPTFRYEKFRAEWSDGKGHVVVDETPIGNFRGNRRSAAVDRRYRFATGRFSHRLHHAVVCSALSRVEKQTGMKRHQRDEMKLLRKRMR